MSPAGKVALFLVVGALYVGLSMTRHYEADLVPGVSGTDVFLAVGLPLLGAYLAVWARRERRAKVDPWRRPQGSRATYLFALGVALAVLAAMLVGAAWLALAGLSDPLSASGSSRHLHGWSQALLGVAMALVAFFGLRTFGRQFARIWRERHEEAAWDDSGEHEP